MEDIYVTRRELASALRKEIELLNKKMNLPASTVSTAYMFSEMKQLLQRLFDAL